MNFYVMRSCKAMISPKFLLPLGMILLLPASAWSAEYYYRALGSKKKTLRKLGTSRNLTLRPKLMKEARRKRPGFEHDELLNPRQKRESVRRVLHRFIQYHPYTLGHSMRVAALAKQTALEMGYDRSYARTVHRTGLLHDTGKLDIAESLLEKPGRLTESEFNIIKNHPGDGARYLSRNLRHMPKVKVLTKGSANHHERWDGRGYPLGIKGEQIPLVARILSVADAFDAMTSQRTYNTPKTTAVALEVIKSEAGAQFDPRVVKVFVEMMEKRGR